MTISLSPNRPAVLNGGAVIMRASVNPTDDAFLTSSQYSCEKPGATGSASKKNYLSREQRSLVEMRFGKGVLLSDFVPTFMACERLFIEDEEEVEGPLSSTQQKKKNPPSRNLKNSMTSKHASDSGLAKYESLFCTNM